MINKKISQFLPYLTQQSKQKFLLYPIPMNIIIHPLNPSVRSLIDRMKLSFSINPIIRSCTSSDLSQIKNTFINFNEDFNHTTKSKFHSDINSMSKLISCDLVLTNGIIRLNFLSSNIPTNTISAIIHAINTFCLTFPYDYNNLKINVSLDENYRIIMTNPGENNFERIFSLNQDLSSAFTVSGLTDKSSNLIILTKREEIIKLMFHEMVHYRGLDSFLHKNSSKYNYSESYTEFMAVLLSSIYQSLHLTCFLKGELYNLVQIILSIETLYSVYLTLNIKNFFMRDQANEQRNKIKCPILVEEYIVQRTNLLLNINKVANLVGDDWIANEEIITIIEDYSSLVEKSLDMPNVVSNNISYMMIDLDYNIL